MKLKDISWKAYALLAVAAAALVAAGVAWGPELFAFFADGERLQAWVEAQGVWAPAAMVALIVAQVVVGFLPGEPVELGAGYAFGFWEGTLLCLIASAIGTVIVLTLCRTLGMKAVSLFCDPAKLENLSWLRDTSRFELVMFAVFLIPGTPKDLLTYAAGFTQCPAWRVVLIATFGRIPSIVSSTAVAGLAASGQWGIAAVVAVATVVLVCVGLAVYAVIVRRKTKASGGKASGGKARGQKTSVRPDGPEVEALRQDALLVPEDLAAPLAVGVCNAEASGAVGSGDDDEMSHGGEISWSDACNDGSAAGQRIVYGAGACGELFACQSEKARSVAHKAPAGHIVFDEAVGL